jgi:hypothetical protein
VIAVEAAAFLGRKFCCIRQGNGGRVLTRGFEGEACTRSEAGTSLLEFLSKAFDCLEVRGEWLARVFSRYSIGVKVIDTSP